MDRKINILFCITSAICVCFSVGLIFVLGDKMLNDVATKQMFTGLWCCVVALVLCIFVFVFNVLSLAKDSKKQKKVSSDVSEK